MGGNRDVVEASAIFERFPLGIVIWQATETAESKKTFVLHEANSAACKFAGFDLSARVGEPIDQVFPEEGEQHIERFLSLLQTGESGQLRRYKSDDPRNDRHSSKHGTFRSGTIGSWSCSTT